MKRLHEHRRQSPVASVIFTAHQDRLRCSTAVYSHLCELAWERVSAAACRGASRLWSPRTRPTGWRCKLSLNMSCEQLPSVHCTGLQGSRSIEALRHLPRCLQKLSDSTNIPVRDVWERRDLCPRPPAKVYCRPAQLRTPPLRSICESMPYRREEDEGS